MSNFEQNAEMLPAVLAGPILRRAASNRLTFWLALRAPAEVRIELFLDGGADGVVVADSGGKGHDHVAAGENLHYVLVDFEPDHPLPEDRWIGYRLSLRMPDEPAAGWQDHTRWAPDLCYPGKDMPGFVLPSRVRSLVHGSCRKPHHPSGDGLVAGDTLLARYLADGPEAENGLSHWPSFLVMTGDQVYMDDVGGPMLRAIHQLLDKLGLPDEKLGALETAELTTATALYRDKDSYYRREHLLPETGSEPALWEVLFGGARKPVFTTDTAHNHLITAGEVLAMYLLCWSPAGWEGLSLEEPNGLAAEESARYRTERPAIEDFVGGLPRVRRLFAHLPVAMIFDDHDVTDDWNLHRDWEETAYGHPFSKRIIGNALLGYFLNQGWGNLPEAFPADLVDAVRSALADPGSETHDQAIDRLFHFEGWDFQWPSDPPLVVLDTRTRRWRSESSGRQPSGLLDWEAITDLQRILRDKKSVLLVSAAPIYGAKLIETIQRIMTMLGKPLLVDAEYWMAHPGTANGILNVFRHRKTPELFTILSGDVHYSFVFDVEIRGRHGGPDIWQICSSGLRNEFPARLLDTLDRLNRVLYAPGSILNWFTKRRRMRVIPRKPVGTPHGRRLLNAAGIGVVEFDDRGAPIRIGQALARGGFVPFRRREEEARWD